MRTTAFRSAVRPLVPVALFAAVHSGLATAPAKRRVRGVLGEDRADGLYRAGYVALALPSVGLLALDLWRLPDRPLYRLRGPLRSAAVAAQAASLLAVGAVVVEVGPARFAGLPQVVDLAAGHPVRPPVVAQHPREGGDRLDWGGPFRLCRHPNNAFPLLAFWLSPTMTVKWASVGAGAALYMLAGSWHEERRLERAYGDRYVRYRRDVPRLLAPLGRLGRPGRRP